MINLRTGVIVAVSLVFACAPSYGAEKRVVGYLAEWAGRSRKYGPAELPADRLTHVNYAFAQVIEGKIAFSDRVAAIERAFAGDGRKDGEVRGNFRQFQILKEKQPHLRTLISVGGWTQSGGFSDAAVTEASRWIFAQSCVEFVTKYGFDGVDIDWEYPTGGGLAGNKSRPEDKHNFTLMLGELRHQLDAQGKRDGRPYLLTIAAAGTPGGYTGLELAQLHPHLDWINLMTYDYAGEWSELTNFNVPLYASSGDPGKQAKVRNADAAVKGFLAAGVSAEKVVVGVPFYGRGWGEVKNANHGLYQPHGKKQPKLSLAYRDVAKDWIGKRGTRYWHDDAKVPWIFDEKAGIMITYDDAESIEGKARYVAEQKLGGVMVWEMSEDDGTLIEAVRRGLGK